MSLVRELFKFRGGLHPPQHKELSNGRPVRDCPLPSELVIPVHQHIGESAEPIVTVGDKVLKGQKIARAQGYVSASVHASSSGTVVAIEQRPIPHPSGLSDLCIVIQPDGEDRWAEAMPIDYRTVEPSTLRNHIRMSGIVGLGGAGFPTYIKLNPTGGTIDTLILNGVECEPYITCDDMLMRERAADILAGAEIMRHALQAKRCIIAVEDNKPEGFAALRAALKDSQLAHPGQCEVEIAFVPTRYPQGSEKQLIKVLTNKESPSDGLPIHIGVVVHNVGTAAAVHRAVNLGRPLVSRIVTVTGDGIPQPANLEVPFGTSMQHVIDQCGGLTADTDRVIIGGPMMGYAMRHTQLPVIKTCNCILALTGQAVQPPAETMPCIRCGACADSCPVSLLPQQLYWYSKSKEFDRAQEHHLFDCIECGCCAFVCPSNIPLVHYYRYAKTEIWAQEREKEKADLARQRHEARLARIDREAAEKAARAAKKKAALAATADAEQPADSKATDAASDDKQAAIAAALERVKAKKAQQAVEPKNTDNLTAAQQQQIDEADQRRAGADKQAAALTADSKDKQDA